MRYELHYVLSLQRVEKFCEMKSFMSDDRVV